MNLVDNMGNTLPDYLKVVEKKESKIISIATLEKKSHASNADWPSGHRLNPINRNPFDYAGNSYCEVWDSCGDYS